MLVPSIILARQHAQYVMQFGRRSDSLMSLIKQGSLRSFGGFERGFTPGVLSWDHVVELLVDLLCAVWHCNEFTARVALVNLSWAYNLVLWVLDELVPVSQPACKARQREHDREHFRRDAQRLIDHSGVEVNVRV